MPFRVGFASSMFTEVNENDAKAAVKVWAQMIAGERNVPTDPEPSIFAGEAELEAALVGRGVDAVAISAEEYWSLDPKVDFEPVFITYFAGHPDEEYVLLVNAASGIESLADLRGKSLVLYDNLRACLATRWLDVELDALDLPLHGQFLGKVTKNTKLTRTVLPVFFKKADACVVTRSGYDTMVELNPQTGRMLKVLATSTKVVPAVFCMRADYSPPFKEELLDALRELHETPAGQQVLTIFQSEKLVETPPSCLASSLDLIERSNKLRTVSETASTSSRSIHVQELQ